MEEFRYKNHLTFILYRLFSDLDRVYSVGNNKKSAIIDIITNDLNKNENLSEYLKKKFIKDVDQ